MRLSDDQVRCIVNATHELSGHDAQVRLFGSRLHDAVKGGDIDLLVECAQATHIRTFSPYHINPPAAAGGR